MTYSNRAVFLGFLSTLLVLSVACTETVQLSNQDIQSLEESTVQGDAAQLIYLSNILQKASLNSDTQAAVKSISLDFEPRLTNAPHQVSTRLINTEHEDVPVVGLVQRTRVSNGLYDITTTLYREGEHDQGSRGIVKFTRQEKNVPVKSKNAERDSLQDLGMEQRVRAAVEEFTTLDLTQHSSVLKNLDGSVELQLPKQLTDLGDSSTIQTVVMGGRGNIIKPDNKPIGSMKKLIPFQNDIFKDNGLTYDNI